MLNLCDFFEQMEKEKYCVVKWNGSITYTKGSDIDLYCYDIKEIARLITFVGKKYIKNNNYQIKITDVVRDEHIHLDFLLNNEIDFRFDLYGTLPNYKKLNIKESFFASVIENAIVAKVEYAEKQININIPTKIDELIIRYFEYIEWYDVRPDKIKHLDFIEEQLYKNEEKDFFDKVHYYTKLPEVKIRKVKFFTRVLNDIRWRIGILRRINKQNLMEYIKRKFNEKK